MRRRDPPDQARLGTLEFGRRHAAGLLVLLVVLAGALWTMGRVWWCEVGDPAPWSNDVWSPHNSQHLVDPYTITHALHGMLAYLVLWWLLGSLLSATNRGLVGIALEVGWEVLENTPMIIERYRETTISLDYYGDSIVNSIGDTLGFVAGYALAAAIPAPASAIGFLLAELVLVVWIRDGLVLNVLMLLYPIEAIRDWQMAVVTANGAGIVQILPRREDCRTQELASSGTGNPNRRLEERAVDEPRNRSGRLATPNRNKMSKQELIQAIREAD